MMAVIGGNDGFDGSVALEVNCGFVPVECRIWKGGAGMGEELPGNGSSGATG